MTDQNADVRPEDVSPHARQVIVALHTDPDLDPEGIADATMLTPTQVQEALTELVDLGLITEVDE